MVLLFSCTTNSNKEKKSEKQLLPDESTITDKDVYDDINLFKLEGVNKISNPTKYPYIKIDSLSPNKKRVVYKKTKNDFVERTYLKENNYWTTSYDYRADTGYDRIYEYIISEKIIDITYTGTWEKTNFHLADISEHEKNKIVMYVIHDYRSPLIIVKPSIKLLELYKNKAVRILTDEYNIRNGVLKIVTNFYDINENKTYYKDTSCYPIENHSWFWWSHFRLHKSINCKINPE